jgi:dTDP-L-rhamnose 4-epimerase
MRVLITGGAGFIASHVGPALSAAGHEVVALDCLHPMAHRRDRIPDGSFLFGDVRDADVVASALRGMDAVVHHAAMVGLGVSLDDLPEYVSCNDLGTAVLLSTMARAKVRRLVLASSMVVYGEGAYSCAGHGPTRPDPRDPADLAGQNYEPRCPRCGGPLEPELVDEDAPLDPRSVYAATKLAQEHLAGAWARETGVRAIALRYHNVYGPGMPRDTPYAGVAAIFRSSLERGEATRIYEDGGQRRDFVHAADVAQANVAALAALAGPGAAGAGPGAAGAGGIRAYNIASGEPHTVLDMATALTDALDGPAPVVTHQFRASDVRHIVASPGRARAELGFTAAVPFSEGMKELATATLRD